MNGKEEKREIKSLRRKESPCQKMKRLVFGVPDAMSRYQIRSDGREGVTTRLAAELHGQISIYRTRIRIAEE